MSLITIPYVFQPGTTIASAQVNADFAAITSVVNGNLDGTNFATIFSSLNLSRSGHATFPGGLIVQWANPSAVPYDNSAALAVTYDIPFVNMVFAVVATANLNTISTPSAITCSAYGTGGPSGLTGFNLTASGGKAGVTGSVFWIAIGY
jgi:hypothetical protein